MEGLVYGDKTMVYVSETMTYNGKTMTYSDKTIPWVTKTIVYSNRDHGPQELVPAMSNLDHVRSLTRL